MATEADAGGSLTSEPKLLYVYEHYAQHDEGWIVGNVDGLLALRNAVDAALNKVAGVDHAEVMAADGEGYDVHVICEDSDWQGAQWGHLFLPYTAEYARDRETSLTLMPWHLLRGRTRTRDGLQHLCATLLRYPVCTISDRPVRHIALFGAKIAGRTLAPLSREGERRSGVRGYDTKKCRWAGIEGTTYVDVDAMGDKARTAVALLRAADPEARACEQVEVHFESSGYYDPGKYSGPPENCYPEEGDDERQVTDVTLLLDQGQVRLADTLVRILASDPVVVTAVNGAEVEPPEPDYDAMWEAKRDREIDW